VVCFYVHWPECRIALRPPFSGATRGSIWASHTLKLNASQFICPGYADENASDKKPQREWYIERQPTAHIIVSPDGLDETSRMVPPHPLKCSAKTDHVMALVLMVIADESHQEAATAVSDFEARWPIRRWKEF